MISINRSFIFIAVIFASVVCGNFVVNSSESKKDIQVYICTGPKSKRYHRTPNCSGLKTCSGSIRKVSKSTAESIRRTPCKKCY